ncbi:MAG: DUF4340 domain-containing protein [Eubacterium sp.]|nr:DUF4340 domain-containing protein [Eubacterium sp.]
MKKKLYFLIGAVVILLVLSIVYVLVSKANKEQQPTADTNSIADLGTEIIKANEVKSFSLNNGNGTFNFVKKGDIWTAEGYNNLLDYTAVENIASVFNSLYAEQTINDSDLAKYGLSKPSAVATCNSISVNVGSLSADNKYYYVAINGDNNIYMVNANRIAPLKYGLNDIVDKSVDKIDSDSIQELSIDYKDRDSILVKYDKDNPIAREYAEKNGLATLVMEKPVDNMLVYPYNLQASVLRNLASLNISDLADIKPDSLAKYGLDAPICTIYVADNDNSIKVKVGNFVEGTDDSLAYVMVNDRPEVFTMEYRALKPFVTASVADFAEKFVSLYQRSKVKSIVINGNKKYTVDFRTEGDNDFKTVDGIQKDYRNTYINNKLVDKDTFTDFYELLIGIGFDNIVKKVDTNGEPALTITFNLVDGSKNEAKYYDYDSNFFVVNKGDESSLLVSKQTVRKVISQAEKLCK